MCRFKDEEEGEASTCVFWAYVVGERYVCFENADLLLKEVMNISGGIETRLQDPKIIFQLHAWPDIMICLVHA